MDVSKAQSFTIERYFDLQTFKLPVVNLGTASSAGLVPGPRGIEYRLGAVNPYAPAGTLVVNNVNWGGYDSPQATPQPTQVIDDQASTISGVNGGAIIIAPAQDAPSRQSAQQDSTSTPAVSSSKTPLTTLQTVDTTA